MADTKPDNLAKAQQRAALCRQIANIDNKLGACDRVKTKLTNCQNALDGEIEAWNGVNRALHSDVRYVRIVTTDIFEGEMANKLGTYMSEAEQDIRAGIADTSELSGKLQAQLGALEAYRARLSAERASLAAQL